MTELLISLIIVVAAALLIAWIAERFSPDPLITKIVQVIVFVLVIIYLVRKLGPLVS